MVTVASLPVVEAYLLRSRLEGAGFVAFVADDLATTMLWGATFGWMGNSTVAVAESDVERAREVLDDIQRGRRAVSPEDVERAWQILQESGRAPQMSRSDAIQALLPRVAPSTGEAILAEPPQPSGQDKQQLRTDLPE
jgi:hypothetical protein